MMLTPLWRGSVQRWECDENDHLNVQFYLARFEEADRQFRLLSGLSDALAGARRARHLRYHEELYSGDTLVMRSHVAFDGPYMLTVVHELRRSADNVLADERQHISNQLLYDIGSRFAHVVPERKVVAISVVALLPKQ